MASVRLRPDCQLFAFDEFDRLVDHLRESRCSHHYVEGMRLLLAELQSGVRVHDCRFGSAQMEVDVKSLLSGLRDERVDQFRYQPLLRQMAVSRINHLAVSVHVPDNDDEPASSTLDFLRADPFRGVIRLDIRLRLSSDVKSSDAALLRAWNCLLQEDVLARLEFLHVYLAHDDRKEGSRLLAASTSTFALPRLQSLVIAFPDSVASVCALLTCTSSLRCLRLRMYGLGPTHSEEEHVTFRDTLLAAISQLTSLVSLSITLYEPADSEKWIRSCSWLTYTPIHRPGSFASACVHLREAVFVALSKLVRLESLSISFPHHKSQYGFDGAALQHDMRRLAATLPRLRVVVLANDLIQE